MKQYHEILPEDYFNNLYKFISQDINKTDNVLISVLKGCGSKTSFLFLRKHLLQNKVAETIHLFDLFLQNNNKQSLREVISDAKVGDLLVIRNLHLSSNPQDFLEELNSLLLDKDFKLPVLAFANHEGIVSPNKYSAKSTPFFSKKYNLTPFSMEELIRMIEISSDYYNWDINPNEYDTLYKLSGGNPRLVKHICINNVEQGIKYSDLETNINDATNNYELAYLAELYVKYDKANLTKLGITDNEGKIKSLLFVEYLKTLNSDFIEKLFPHLSDLEIKVLSILFLNLNQIVRIEKIGDIIYPDPDDYSLWAIYKLISRLKPKVKSQFIIDNVKGKGYIMRAKPTLE
ncbi:helix-turn-helix domain-containing protein [Candidatus Dojkabacteria bacterium]|uniref:Helix-turn-helix domain-containing protein n=1 Tax=Candidatus Dojkabacteria bacterium TaxID=2099670 RepID=A0A955RHE4_9BACT|nr:helix-turn-helix domain-containing protein [Candidatus Dojkabacteria bacterium]